jgi:hypothetical protein
MLERTGEEVDCSAKFTEGIGAKSTLRGYQKCIFGAVSWVVSNSGCYLCVYRLLRAVRYPIGIMR